MRFQVFTAVEMWIVVLWVLTQCGLAGSYQHFFFSNEVFSVVTPFRLVITNISEQRW
jgi:hypothetical protein